MSNETQSKMRVGSRSVNGAFNAKFIASELIERSTYFEVTPLPEDWYEFTLKDDGVQAFNSASLKLNELHREGLIVSYVWSTKP